MFFEHVPHLADRAVLVVGEHVDDDRRAAGPYASYCASSYDTPGSSPVPRRIARLMFSAGMLAALASAMIVRRRGFMSGSPPPARAATVNSLMRRVKILPRLASRAPFLCLMEAHLEWPDM